MNDGSYNPMSNPRFVIGAAIALFGFVLMLDRLHVVNAEVVLRFWPVIIIAIGLQRFANPLPGRSNTGGIVLIVFGGVLLLNSLGVLGVSIWQLVWPVALIWFGWHLMQRPSPPRAAAVVVRPLEGAAGAAPVDASADVDPSDTLSVVAVMASAQRHSTSSNFHGGEVLAFMGGASLDLRDAGIRPGQTASVEVMMVMSGLEVIVPAHWIVHTPVVPIMGGVEDRRLAPPPDAAQVAGQAAPELTLHGFVFMGGVSIVTEPQERIVRTRRSRRYSRWT